MRTLARLTALIPLAVLVSCGKADERRANARPQAPVPLTVSIQGASEIQTVWATVEAVPAPAVQFKALIRPDPNHMVPITSPASGLIVRIRPEGHVARNEPVAVVVQRAPVAGREMTIAAKRDGVWHPRRQVRQLTLANDTLGVLEEHGYWLAVGAVSDIEYRVIHPGDPALVQLTDDRHDAKPARVEWVRPPWEDAPYSADVAVEFQGSDSPPAGPGAITVIIIAGPGDSAAGVPASSVVHLPPGPAVFVAAGQGRYEVRWISTGPRVDGLVFVREGVQPGTSVVAGGVAALVGAALDSLERRTSRRPGRAP